MGIAILAGFLVYFCVAVATAHRSRKAFWINFCLGAFSLLLLSASHTDHNTPMDGLIELFLLGLFAALIVITGFAWLCSFLLRAADKAMQDPGVDA